MSPGPVRPAGHAEGVLSDTRGFREGIVRGRQAAFREARCGVLDWRAGTAFAPQRSASACCVHLQCREHQIRLDIIHAWSSRLFVTW